MAHTPLSLLSVLDLDGEGSALHMQAWAVEEKRAEFLRVQRGRRDDHAQVRAERQHLPDNAKEDVCLQAALVGFIEDDD